MRFQAHYARLYAKTPAFFPLPEQSKAPRPSVLAAQDLSSTHDSDLPEQSSGPESDLDAIRRVRLLKVLTCCFRYGTSTHRSPMITVASLSLIGAFQMPTCDEIQEVAIVSSEK